MCEYCPVQLEFNRRLRNTKFVCKWVNPCTHPLYQAQTYKDDPETISECMEEDSNCFVRSNVFN